MFLCKSKGLLQKINEFEKLIQQKQKPDRYLNFEERYRKQHLKLGTDPRGADPNRFERTVPDCNEC